MTAHSTPQKHKTNTNTELAKMRNRDAVERTLMAWIRTALSLIGFGFGIDKITEALEKSQLGETANLFFTARLFGMSFITLGVFAVIVALIQYRQELRHLEEAEYRYMRPFPLGFVVASVIALIGVFTLLSIVVKFFA